MHVAELRTSAPSEYFFPSRRCMSTLHGPKDHFAVCYCLHGIPAKLAAVIPNFESQLHGAGLLSHKDHCPEKKMSHISFWHDLWQLPGEPMLHLALCSFGLYIYLLTRI